MKLNEVADKTPQTQDAVMSAVAATLNVRHASLTDLEVTEDGASWAGVYEFPEHRNGLSADIRKIVGSVGKLTAEKADSEHGEFALLCSVKFKTPISSNSAKELEKKILEKHKDKVSK